MLRALTTGLAALWVLLAGGGDPLVDPSLLTWKPPRLNAPITLTVPPVTPDSHGLLLELDPARDYVVELAALSGPGGLALRGGRNVVIVGGLISVPDITTPTPWIGRCLTITDNVGTVHIEGVQFENCGDGIVISSPASTVQIQNVRFNDVESPFDLSHSDVIQTWRGPRSIRIDRFTADFASKGFLWTSVDGTYPRRVEQRRINFRRWSRGGAHPEGPHIFTWHTSPSTSSTCFDCWSEMGWYDPTYRRKLQDGWGTFDNPDGTNAFVPYRLGRNGRRPVVIESQEQHRRATGDLGRRQGDYMERLAPSLVGERWYWGIPPGGDFVPQGVPGPAYRSPGYR